jgi:hypothetical protein
LRADFPAFIRSFTGKRLDAATGKIVAPGVP